jgi:galactitol-specific phosphotransferase system IIB component
MTPPKLIEVPRLMLTNQLGNGRRMASANRSRIFGDKITFKSLSCAPVNELGVVYLFGVLHETFDFKIESIQSGYPDCLARRKVSHNRWEEVRIEFEYESRSFKSHGHDPSGVDVIVCWTHNWKECPKSIEIIEMSSFLGDAEQIDKQIKEKKSLNEWQLFCQQKRLEGLTFAEIAPLWKKTKRQESAKKRRG